MAMIFNIEYERGSRGLYGRCMVDRARCRGQQTHTGHDVRTGQRDGHGSACMERRQLRKRVLNSRRVRGRGRTFFIFLGGGHGRWRRPPRPPRPAEADGTSCSSPWDAAGRAGRAEWLAEGRKCQLDQGNPRGQVFPR